MVGSGGIEVTFWGVRGSTPCSGPQYARYGGNSSCVALEAPGEDPIVLDLGTGLRPYGDALGGAGVAFRGSVLLTHLHWDHVQGLPFFEPLHHPDSWVDVYGPRHDEGPLGEVFDALMRPPFFPIRSGDLLGALHWHDIGNDCFSIGSARVRSAFVRHTGRTLGFRIEWHGAVVTYLADHGQACPDSARGLVSDSSDDHVPAAVLELCDGADLLIHDAQHTPAEFGPKRTWGHCTNEYALHVATQSGARRLALFHHCPTHGDEMIDTILRDTRDLACTCGGPEVIAATERETLRLGGVR
jgi:phosphoribosyl 1,2-cyclic phosphodiesterase